MLRNLRPAAFAWVLGCLVSACTSLPPLNDARLLRVSVGTPEEVTRADVRWDFPVLHLHIETERNLLDSDGDLGIGLCGDEMLYRRAFFMWRDRIVWPGVDQSTFGAALRDQGTTQRLEIVLNYTWWQKLADDSQDQVTLQPLERDMCVAFQRFNKPFPTTVGAPLRVPKEMVNAALQPLPSKIRRLKR